MEPAGVENPTDEVGSIIDLDELITSTTNKNKLSFCLVGKLYLDKPWKPFYLIEVMKKSWRPKGQVEGREWGKGLILFRFENEEDRNWVIHNQPWHYENGLFAVRKIREDEQPSEVNVNHATIWTRVDDVPAACMNSTYATLLANQIGQLEILDNSTEGLFGKFLRFKVQVDLTKPLVRGITVKLKGKLCVLPLKYESLPTYCFCCGTIGHFFRNCSEFDKNDCQDTSDMRYGPWLKASPFKCTTS
ncbi:hypothetical protein DH2020_006105 [Rehmannia glutinosa]|uniref:CCHC-type domain-containing protein n=1 Tax=Rehmannia glutinosa TaxID=99300 RepID=A0ABR0XIJ7_REHGL